jgi:hypothetical protein
MASTLRAIEPAGGAPLAPLLADARPGVRIVVISDYLGDEEETRTAARALLAAHSDVHAVHVVAREEIDPSHKAIRALDPEDASVERPFDETMRSRYVTGFADWRQQIAEAWRHAGATWTVVTTGEDPAMCVRRVVGASSRETVVHTR